MIKMKSISIVFLALCLLCCSGISQTRTDSLFQKLRAFDYGQPTAVLEQIERLVCDGAKDVSRQQAMADRLAAILDSNAPFAARDFACRQLTLIGSDAQLPALQKYVLDKALSNIVLFALARFPQSEHVDLTLRKALEKAQGPVRVAVIKAIAVRRDPKAVDMLKKIVAKDKSDSTRNAALLALAHIGGEKVLQIVQQASQLAAYSEALLLLADTATADQATTIYETLSRPGQKADLRSAGLAGLIRLQNKKAIPLLLQFLGDADINLLDAALGCIRRTKDAELIRQLIAQMPSLAPERQTLVIQALADTGNKTIAVDAEGWAKSENDAVREAAVEALGKIGGVSSVQLLLQRAVAGTEAERKAAANSLITLLAVDDELIRLLDKGGLDAERKIAVLSALSGRIATAAVPLILQTARDENEQVRKESFKALYVLAGPQDLQPLLQLVLTSPESSLPDAEKALAAVTKRLQYDQSFLDQLVANLNSSSDVKVKCSLLRLLSGIGQPSTLPVLRQALQDKSQQVQEMAIRGLSTWPNAVPAEDLLLVSAKSKEPLHRILAMQGYLNIISADSTVSETAKVARFVKAVQSAQRDQEKKLAFSHLARLANMGVLDQVAPYLQDAAVCDEAAMAMISVSKKSWAREQAAVRTAMQAVNNSKCSATVKAQAQDVLNAYEKAKAFIIDWQAAGPFSIPSVPASLLFTLQLDAEFDWGGAVYKPFVNAFDPERPYYMDLANTLKGRNNQTAYLSTYVHSPQQQQVILLLGSDDGAKIWLNGKEVFAKNTARTFQIDQDRVPVTLKQGWNKIMLKIMQAEGADWGASLRICTLEGGPVSGLLITSDNLKAK
jgi:HEAT repeat protein